jgi:hypothetical protein
MEEPARFKVKENSKERWGFLVKDWAKGEKPCPKNLTELLAQCAQGGIEVEVPTFITGIVFVQNDKHVLTVRLPPKELLVAGEEFIRQTGEAYPLPNFYLDFFSQATLDENLSSAKREKLHAARVGEYSVNSCA